ncbi:MAG: pilus assembly protein [Pseudobutyrivibrio sp.]|nr:pilus assembly protein [Pseudobutyrivibrio sp.]
MSLLKTKYHFSFAPRKINKKEKCGFHILRKVIPQEIPFHASLLKASYTIETAVILPIFISVMMFGIFTFQLLRVQAGVQQALDTASRQLAVAAGAVEKNDSLVVGLAIAYADEEILNSRIPLSFVVGDIGGINYLGSSTDGNYIDLHVSYLVHFPVGLLGNYTYPVTQRSRSRKWVGYDRSENEGDGIYVYMTDKGEVYHTSLYCTYLSPSVRQVARNQVDDSRNASGGIYYPCHKCKDKEPGEYVYVTDYGTAYHNDVACTNIRHNINKVLYESVKGRVPACSKCGK